MKYTEYIIPIEEEAEDHDEKNSELIRCKDCKYASVGRNEVDSWLWCKAHGHSFEMNDYCSWAERKEEE